jgi:hypothetical protein
VSGILERFTELYMSTQSQFRFIGANPGKHDVFDVRAHSFQPIEVSAKQSHLNRTKPTLRLRSTQCSYESGYTGSASAQHSKPHRI